MKIPVLKSLKDKEVVTIKMPKYLGEGKDGKKKYDMNDLIDTQIALPTGWKAMLAKGDVDVEIQFINNVQTIDNIQCFVAWIDQVTQGK